MWVVAKIKALAQERIIKRASLWGKNLLESIEEFYYPSYKKIEDRKEILPSCRKLLFINFNNLNISLLTKWMSFEPNLFWFYESGGTIGIINDWEIKNLKKGVEEYIKKEEKAKKEFSVGTLVRIINHPLAGFQGRIKAIKGEHVILKIFDIELKSEWKIRISSIRLLDVSEKRRYAYANGKEDRRKS